MPAPDHLTAAAGAYSDARAAIAAYRLAEARRKIETARHHLGQLPRDEGFELGLRIRLTESWLTCDDHGLPAALAQIDAVLREAVAAGRDDIRALAHIQAGVLGARAGNFDEALEQLRPAVKYSAAFPLDDRVRLLLNKGTIGSRTGSLDEAAGDLRAAAHLGSGLPAYRFMALHNLGFVQYLRGDLPAALRLMAQADELEADVDRSVARHDRARVLLEAGLIEEAAELFDTAVKELRLAGLAEEWAEARLDQARCAALTGHTPDAVRLATEVMGDATARGEPARAHEARSMRLEALLLGPGMPDVRLGAEAAELASAARAARRPWLADRATALHLIAAAGHGTAVPDVEAVRCLRRMRASPYLSTRMLAILAQLSTTTDQQGRGRLLRAAARDTAAARSGMASLDLRTAVAIHLAPIVRSDLERVAGSGDGWAALLATERWRAALAEVPSVVPPADAWAATRFSTLRRHHEELRTADPGRAGALRVEIGGIERELREHHWARRERGPVRLPGRLLRADLGAASVLSYFWSGDTLHLVHVEPGFPARLLRVGDRAEVSDLVAGALADASAASHAPPGPLAAAVLSSLAASLERLEELILPVELGTGPLVVIPSGELARLPWGMLPRLRHRGLALSRSVGAWAAGAVRLAGPPRVAVASGPGLALAEAECTAVAGCWAGARRVPAEPAAVKEALAAYDVVHIAAHGQHREDSPLFSSLRLHGGSLFAHELEHVPIRASLVVLSACGAGRGRLRPGDEALGLTSSLLAMGVGAVVAPLTDVPDALASRTMGEMHRRLAAGQDGPEALAAAGDGLLERSFAWFGSNWRAGPNR
ncbi:CHAT domain-containing protein [Paeniglutamicibacter sp. ABSL32-1]|uniref:CHAT domain-containing protein n=1 Tax=Paeniglutamicibacter quisquiliarum TaxID=2849498 RepID=UPI001C2DDEFE|nr:CHAT domain-containing protein [Paeniglutamicibacter quisquiliarum]MBV1778024.1 CHAT domain-containing protein [Paeniglutamicibacter quisquiliarum]